MTQKIQHADWKDGCTERINRLRNAYWAHTPELDVERARIYTQVYKENEAAEVIIKRARAMRRYIETKTILIAPDELIVGTDGNKQRAAVVCPEHCYQWYMDELDTCATRSQDPYFISEESKKILREEVFPYWKGKSMEDFFMENLPDDMKKIGIGTNIVFGDLKATGGAGEFCVGYGNIVLKKGFKAIGEEARKYAAEIDINDPRRYEKEKFYEAVLICCDAAKILGRRYADEARRQAEAMTDETRRQELLQIAEVCDRVPYEPPRNFREAVQAVWLTQILLWAEENTNSYCIDRPDQIWYSFYKQDIENGTLTKEEALELIECFWIKMAEMIFTISAESAEFYAGYMAFNGLTLAGVDEDGKDAVNELSYLMLQATMDLRMHAPTINVRIGDHTPDAYFEKVLDLVKLGTGQPAIFFDKTAIELLRRRGVPERIARNWGVGGCVEPNVPGITHMWGEGCRYAYPAAVEWALTNGYSKATGKQLGLETGDPKNFETFEEFEAAVKKQLAYIIEVSAKFTQLSEICQKTKSPKPVRSMCVQGCIEHGIDCTGGGADYNNGPGLEPTGVADLTDSVMAVKKLVYDEKAISMDELLKALDADFEGYEIMRQQLINNAPKYGNDDDEVDGLARKYVQFSCDEAAKYRSTHGSHFLNGLVPVSSNIPHGKAIWALPSGRKAGEPLSDGVSPFPGYDTNGPTAVLKSICKIDHAANGAGTLLNMKLNPNMLETEISRKNFISLLKSERDMGGYHIQFNVVDSNTLRAAKKEPQKYSDLLVRVAGYSAFFVDLADEAQDVIINRTENTMW